MANEKVLKGPYWTRNWIEAMWRFTNENFVNFDTGAVDYEALGKEEFQFRKALFFRNFKNSERAKMAFAAAEDDYKNTVENGKKGGRPKKSPQDAPNGNAGVDMYDAGNGAASKSTTSCDTFTADVDIREVEDVSTTVSMNMRRVPQNEAPAHGFSGGRTAQGTMSRSPEAAAQSGKASALDGLPDKDGQSAKTMDNSASCRYAPPSCSPEDGNHYDQDPSISTDNPQPEGLTGPSHGGSVASLEALESQRRALANAQKCGRTSQSHSANARPRASFSNKEEFIQWAIDDGLDPVDADECWEATEERGGNDAYGNTVKNMKAFARKWCRTRANNRRTA